MVRLRRLWKKWARGLFLSLLRSGAILLAAYFIYLDAQISGWKLTLVVVVLQIFVATSLVLLRKKLAGGKMKKE